MTNEGLFNGLIIGAAAAAIGTIIAFQFLQRQSVGGASPAQPAMRSYNARDEGLTVYDAPPLPDGVAPVQQTNPITEASYNLQSVDYEPAFNTNYPAEEAILPQ